MAVIFLFLTATKPVAAQVPPLAPSRRAELEAVVAKNQAGDTARTAVEIAYLVNDMLSRNQLEAAHKLTSRLINDIKLLPDAPFDYYTYCAFEEVVGNFEKANCDRDAQQVLAACFTKQSFAKSPKCTTPVAISIDWFTDAFRTDPVKWEAAKELWLSTIEKTNGPNSDATAFVCDRRAKLLQEKEHFAQALRLIQRTAQILQRQDHPASTEMKRMGCYAIASHGLDYEHASERALAEQTYKIAIKLGDTITPKECEPVDAELWLASLYAREGRITEANMILQKAGDKTATNLPPEKKYLIPYIREAIKECILFEDYQVPQQFLPTAVNFSRQPDSNVSIEQQLTNAFRELDDGNLACEMQERVIAFDKKLENNSRAVTLDLELYDGLQELKRKHVRAIGTHTPGI
jgi:tetratricopeptide (TPR) repeat protein